MTDFVRAKKRLGQHFLKDENIAKDIVDMIIGKDKKQKEKIRVRILNTVTFNWWKYRRFYWVYLIFFGGLVLIGYLNSE